MNRASVVREQSFAVVGLTAFATLVKGWTCRFAYTTYEETQIELRNYASSEDFNIYSFLTKMQVLDDTITDFTPPTDDQVVQDYIKKFHHDPL